MGDTSLHSYEWVCEFGFPLPPSGALLHCTVISVAIALIWI